MAPHRRQQQQQQAPHRQPRHVKVIAMPLKKFTRRKMKSHVVRTQQPRQQSDPTRQQAGGGPRVRPPAPSSTVYFRQPESREGEFVPTRQQLMDRKFGKYGKVQAAMCPRQEDRDNVPTRRNPLDEWLTSGQGRTKAAREAKEARFLDLMGAVGDDVKPQKSHKRRQRQPPAVGDDMPRARKQRVEEGRQQLKQAYRATAAVSLAWRLLSIGKSTVSNMTPDRITLS